MESIKGKNLNKGEWAEFYVMLRLLGEGKLYAADNLLRKKPNVYLDVLRVIRQELKSVVMNYEVDENTHTVCIKTADEVLMTIPMSEFTKNADRLFQGIKPLKGNSVPAPDDVCDFAYKIRVSQPKAPAVKSLMKQLGGKNDIYIEVRDSQTAIVSVMGFSIKSKFGQNPTLFNAGSSSQLEFLVDGCDDTMMKEFNAISDEKGRAWGKCREYLKEHNLSIRFDKLHNPNYANNLFLVRESMSKILAWYMKDRLIDSNESHEVKETTERLMKENPLGVPNPEVYYEKAVKDFLMAGFTGMTACKVWDGREQVSGGYIVVMEDGEVLCYHSSDREAFRDYLYRNTFFEYVSSTKYKWSNIVKEGSEYRLWLNFSVRFRKQTR